MIDSCLPCSNWSRLDELPRAESIAVGAYWRAAHAFNSALPGWLVIVSRRHVASLDELDADEVADLGPLLRALTGALRSVVGCTRTYVMLLVEAAGFSHLHFHVVPRMPDLPDHLRGPAIFQYLRQPESQWVSGADLDSLAQALKEALPHHWGP